MNFNVPGLRNSDAAHWQSLWEKEHPEQFTRIQQENWLEPECSAWTQQMENTLSTARLEEAILIGHSVGCAAIAHWFARYQKSVKGALLVAPSDVERPGYPTYIKGFSPMPLTKLPFKTIVVASTNDHVVALERARYFADCWGSGFEILPEAGHIEGKSGYGAWPEGLELLDRFR